MVDEKDTFYDVIELVNKSMAQLVLPAALLVLSYYVWNIESTINLFTSSCIFFVSILIVFVLWNDLVEKIRRLKLEESHKNISIILFATIYPLLCIMILAQAVAKVM